MRLSTLGALVGLALAASGCQEQPSYAIRWRIEPRDNVDAPQTAAPQDVEMTNPSVCSRAGISDVEVWAFDEQNVLADVLQYPCFPAKFRKEGRSVNGSTLPPGEYTLILAGTRANGLPWGTCPTEATPEATTLCNGESVGGFLEAADTAGTPLCVEGECNVGLLSCDCTTFTVQAEQTQRVPDLVLEAPPDCEDGIDGDADGLVDQLDPGCKLGDSESTPVLTPELELSISVLSGNPAADCGNVGIGSLGLTIDGNEQEPILCNVGTTRFSTPLAVGPHELSVVGLGPSQGGPVTVEKTLSFTVNNLGVATPRSLEIDFADVDLLEPIEAQLRFIYYLSIPGDDDAPPVLCTDARVGATEFRYRVLDLGGQQVRSFGAPLDGSASTCIGATIVSLEAPTWGGYAIEIEGFNANGDLCWSNADAPALLTPTEAQAAVLPPADDAPASCFSG